MSNVSDTSDAKFDEEVLQASELVLVDFWAPWCVPCKSIAPVIDEIASHFGGKLKVFKMNVDENPATPSKYDVRGIPNLVFFKGGELVDRVVGAVPKEQLVEIIDKMV